MPESKKRHALECLRLEAECRQLAFDAHSPALRAHFLQMAKNWLAMSAAGPAAATETGPI